MRLGVLLAEIVGIIGADHGNPGFLMDFQNRLVYQLLIPDTVVLKLQIKVLRAKQLRHLKGVCLGVIIFAVAETAGNLTCQTGGPERSGPWNAPSAALDRFAA